MFSVILFGVIAVLMAIDVTIEIRSGVPLGLESFELVIFLLALGGIAIHWWRLTEARAEVKRWTEDARRWNQEAQDILQGLGVAIDRQFDRWGLSPAEREIALLQLKGLRHKEIADLRKTSERTVRQQALSVYRKSGLNGRNDLAAFFLEDLLLPAGTSSDVRASGS
ncbi:MAG: LuxR family transcriptional regulator [Acidobacteria bacterium]|nr:MAG: LuxR family transcriptional regulator [Acidobacteriota bacterium]PYQ87140.1 MAG: LuxR family transcriptional regulator [Acidobacteriota bacterium]PYQ87245.1 MAG: LuxR family transcriptional regulator [Acidobacteriota bacterium]PYR05379.1 MAG: LuxR family transcriptional regulator [Acidobacteriota bacterium]